MILVLFSLFNTSVCVSMAEGPKYQLTFQFKNVQLFKDQCLGIGSYGAVCRAKCDDLLCAAKIIHPTLFDPTALYQIAPQREHRLPIRRFEQECEFMSVIRHPNIVQYLGMFRDTDTHLPVLLMELMDDSLTHFLEDSTQPIPYHIQVNICHDITLALSFLHSNNIVHRDLSSNNILLRGNILAKVTDFGMARLGDINPQATRFTNTMCPGTDVYMPPEAVQDKPVYTEKIDCFSFGIIAIQILTRQFPKPGDRLQEIELNDPGLPPGKLLVQAPEVNRRQNHISQIPPNHSLLPIALDCLKDEDNERPSAHQLCERVADLKGMPKYVDSVRTTQDKDAVIHLQDICMKEKEHTIVSKEEENQQLRQELRKERDQANIARQLNQKLRQINQLLRQLKQKRDQTLQERETQLGLVNQQLEASEQMVAQFERRIAELEQQLSQREQQNSKASSRGKELTSFKLRWREGKRAPCTMSRWCDTVVDGNIVYIRNEERTDIYSYDFINDSWSQLPDCVYGKGAIAIINGCLSTVGEYSRPTRTNEMFTLTGEGSGRRWVKKYPPMPTWRRDTTAVCIGTKLIVAGGRGAGGRVLSTVEVMDTENHQWFTAASLPEPLYLASATVCGDQLYMLGGVHKDSRARYVCTCSVSALLQSCVPNTLEVKLEGTSLEDKANVWRQVADLPVTRSACESFHGRLLAFGGRIKDSWEPTTAVYMYNSTTNSWEIINHMTTPRCDCFTAVLPDNRIMVVGGTSSERFICTDTVEFASVDA